MFLFSSSHKPILLIHNHYTQIFIPQLNIKTNHACNTIKMQLTKAITLITTTARAVLAAPPNVTTFTFPEGSGVEGTVKVDLRGINSQIQQYEAEARAAGFNETISLMAAGKPKPGECDICLSICIPLCLFPPACIGCRKCFYR